MEDVTGDSLEARIAWHVEKILLTQDAEGMIPSYITVSDSIDRKKDIVRQSMANMALMFAQQLVPTLDIQKQINLSERYVQDNLESQTPIQKLYIMLYTALAEAYAKKEVSIALVHQALVPDMLSHPIAVGLYLRLSGLLPKPLPHTTYLQEVLRYNLCLAPRQGRFFDYADTLVWAKSAAPELAQQEYQYLESCYTADGWFKDLHTGVRAWSSPVGKVFEVLAYYAADAALVERLYTRLLHERATSHYAKQTLGKYHEHILSQPNTLYIDDVHMHVLVGLCYLLADKQKNV